MCGGRRQSRGLRNAVAPFPKTHGRRPRFFSVVLCASALLFTTNSVSAQTTSLGTIAGTITDQTNAVISGATVTIKDTATRAVRTTSSNYAGQYVFVNVHPGTYDITIFKPSFSKVSIPHDLVQLGPLSTHNVILRIGSDSQTLEVAATGVELQSDNATVGNRVPALALNALPSIGRDTSTFTTLQPGITPDGSVAGVAIHQSSFQLDGGDNTNDMDGTMGIYRPSYAGAPPGGVASQSNGVAAGASGVMPTPVDSVEELKVNVAGMAADFNSSAGAQVQIVTKRGTDQWHGTAYCALMIHETKDDCCLSAASQSVPR